MTLRTPWVQTCAVCREELPPRGNRRLPIPWLGGRKKLVHADCAPEVERQATLRVPRQRRRVA